MKYSLLVIFSGLALFFAYLTVMHYAALWDKPNSLWTARDETSVGLPMLLAVIFSIFASVQFYTKIKDGGR